MQSSRYTFRILMKLNFLERFERNAHQIPNFTNIRPVGTELVHADRRTEGQTDTTKLRVAFRTFSNTSKNLSPSVKAAQRCLSQIRRIWR